MTRVRVQVHVDDVGCRGSKQASTEFWQAMEKRFALKHWAFVEPGSPAVYCGVRISTYWSKGVKTYTMDQNADVQAFVSEHCGHGMRALKAPMPKKYELKGETEPASASDSRWFRSVLMSCSWFACMTRVDLSYPVSRLAQFMACPTVGAVTSLKRVLAYMLGRQEFTLSCQRVAGNTWDFYVDSDVAGDVPISSRSQTGVVLMLNGMPVLWRSNKQPKTALSSAAAEIYAFSEAVKDAKLLLWRAEDWGIEVHWPCVIKEDNAATVSFQASTAMNSKLKGVFNLRDEWVKELKEAGIILAEKVDTRVNIADLLTKCHEWHTMCKLLRIMNCDVEKRFD